MRKVANLVAVIFVVALGFSAAACGGSPTSPTSPTQANEIRYTVELGVSDADRNLVQDQVEASQRFFSEKLGRGMVGQITVNIKASSCDFGFGQAQRGQLLEICTGGQFQFRSDVRKRETVSHEAFHIVQQQVAPWLGVMLTSVPPAGQWWLAEGSAEFVGYSVVVSQGYATWSDVRSCQVSDYVGGSDPSAPLSQVTQTTRGNYLTSWVAWDRLVGGYSGIAKIGATLRSGASFDQIFGSIETFYADFEAYRRTLQRSSCNIP